MKISDRYGQGVLELSQFAKPKRFNFKILTFPGVSHRRTFKSLCITNLSCTKFVIIYFQNYFMRKSNSFSFECLTGKNSPGLAMPG